MKKRIGIILPLVIFSALIYFFRPWIHSIVMQFYVNPFLIQSILIFTFLGATIFYRKRKKLDAGEDDQSIKKSWKNIELDGKFFSLLPGLFFAVIIIGGIANTAYTNVSMAQDVQEGLTEIDSLPDIDNENPRIIPRTVASEYAENSLQEPRHRLASSDIAISENGTPYWSHPLQPDGGINSFIIKQKGAAFVDMTTSDADVSYNEQEMDVGIGMKIFDNINWVLKKERFWVNYEDNFLFENEGQNYIATPYIEYDFRFKFPFVYTVPKWGGVALTDHEGNTEFIDSEDVENHSVLGNQRNYPFDLARKYVSSMEYREGILNKWFFHKNQLEVAPVPGFNNDQPFMILTEDNPELFVATEPYGDASGLFEIWTIDAITGEYEVYRLDRNQGLIGANRAVNFVRQANSRVNWAGEDSNTGFSPIEPLPVIVDDKLYWQVRVVPLDSAGIAFTSFVDAESTNVYTAQNDQEIIDFLEGEDINQTVVPDDTGNQTGNIQISIVENGEVIETVTTEDRDFDIQVRKK